MDSRLMNAAIGCIVTIQIINFSVGLPLNCYIIKLLLSKGGGVDVSVVFVLNHTAAEIIYCLVAPLYIVCIISLELCVGPLLGLWIGTCMPARYLFQCWVCVERYMAVIHPVTFLRFKPIRYRVACAAVAWIWALAMGTTSMCTFPLLPYTAFGVLYLIIFLLDSFCCVMILKGLLRPGPGDREREDREMNAAKKKAFKVVCMNLLTFLIQTIPIVFSFGLQDILLPDHFHLAVAIGMTINIAAGFVHPIFVLHKAGKLSFIKC
ncbi:G-protein coupled receptor 4-like [Colossoma macropomum]|uniref:G-protein coupled receptor 4-like n=1 Tax=Colossoma macropomum TaxID=42526 RepID=UPI00186444CC|nr:G-protein coupled receptor 4-like [Colossoma macropomum]